MLKSPSSSPVGPNVRNSVLEVRLGRQGIVTYIYDNNCW